MGHKIKEMEILVLELGKLQELPILCIWPTTTCLIRWVGLSSLFLHILTTQRIYHLSKMWENHQIKPSNWVVQGLILKIKRHITIIRKHLHRKLQIYSINQQAQQVLIRPYSWRIKTSYNIIKVAAEQTKPKHLWATKQIHNKKWTSNNKRCMQEHHWETIVQVWEAKNKYLRTIQIQF